MRSRAIASGASGVLLDLPSGRRGRPEVGHGRGHQQHVAGGEQRGTGVGQLGRGLDLAHGDARGRGKRHVRGDDGDGGAARARPARRARSPSARDERLPTKRTPSIGSRVPPAVTSTRSPASERIEEGRSWPRRRPAAPEARRAAPPRAPLRCQRALARVDDHRSPVAQQGDVRLRRRVIPHCVVHRRRDHERAARGERRGGEQVVGEAAGQLGDRVRRGRRDQEDVGARDELEVPDRLVPGERVAGERAAQRVALELARQHGRAGERFERRGTDEALARRGLDDADAWPTFVARRTSSSAL